MKSRAAFCAKQIDKAEFGHHAGDLLHTHEFDAHVAIGALVDAATHAKRILTLGGARIDLAFVEVVHHVVLADTQKRFVHRDVDGFALARLLGAIKSRQSGRQDRKAREVVASVGKAGIG